MRPDCPTRTLGEHNEERSVPALLIINYGEILNEEQLVAYRGPARKILMDDFGGKATAATDSTINLGEGFGVGPNTVAIEFESVEIAQAAYDSDAYQEILGQRLASTRAGFALVVPLSDT